MSAPQVSKSNGKGAPPQGGASEDNGSSKKADRKEAPPQWADTQGPLALMKEMGATNWDPIPPDQHRWHKRNNIPEPVRRIWGWLMGHTVEVDNRTAYATRREKDGTLTELHIEHIAADLEMDLANAYMYWKKGARLGIFRNGNEAEGERRLYLRGKVRQADTSDQPVQAEPIVCTYNWPDPILKKIEEWGWNERLLQCIKHWEPERVLRVGAELEEVEAAKDVAVSAAVAAIRYITTQEEDTIWNREGVKPNRQEHTKKGESEDEAAARRARFTPILEPLQLYVHTIRESVQSPPKTPYNGQNGDAATGASLLGVEPLREDQSKGSTAGRTSIGGPSAKNSHEEVKHAEYLHAGELPVLQTQEARDAEALLFDEIKRSQEFYKHEDFSSELISKKNKSHRLFIRRLLWVVRPANALDFCFQVVAKFKGLDRNALGKLPARSPSHPNGPRSLGLILTWAMDYHSKLDPDPHCDRNLAELILAAGAESTWVSESDRDWARTLLNRKGRTNGGAQ